MINYGTNGKNLISNKKYKIRNTKWASPDSQWFGLFIFSSFLHTHTERHFFVIWSPLFRILPISTQVECYFCILIYFLYYYWVGYLAATFILIRILNTLTFLFQPSHQNHVFSLDIVWLDFVLVTFQSAKLSLFASFLIFLFTDCSLPQLRTLHWSLGCTSFPPIYARARMSFSYFFHRRNQNELRYTIPQRMGPMSPKHKIVLRDTIIGIIQKGASIVPILLQHNPTIGSQYM